MDHPHAAAQAALMCARSLLIVVMLHPCCLAGSVVTLTHAAFTFAVLQPAYVGTRPGAQVHSRKTRKVMCSAYPRLTFTQLLVASHRLLDIRD